jgi:hypothetical protein
MQITNVNIFLSAKKPEKLIELQVINNTVNGTHFNYQTPVYDGVAWYVWFFVDIENWINPSEIKGNALKLAKGEL